MTHKRSESKRANDRLWSAKRSKGKYFCSSCGGRGHYAKTCKESRFTQPKEGTYMLAYHGDPKNKAAILNQLRAHAKADEIVKGQYWENGKGCAVGCTVHSNDHSQYEPRFGIPQALARLEDTIFEGLPNGRAKKWPIQFMSSAKPGTDLSRVHWQFLHWILTDESVTPGVSHLLVKEAVKRCADLMADLGKGNSPAASAAESAAWSAESAARSAKSAAWSAESAARSAESAAWSAAASAARSAESAAASAAASAAWSAERSAESAAASAARSAESAAWSAAASAAWSAASAAASAARSAAYVKMADKLIELMKAA